MHADYAQPAVGGQRGRSDLRTEIEIIQRNFVAEAIEFPELELISAQISFQNITANTKKVNIQTHPETKIRKINLKTFLFNMKTATLRVFSPKKFTNPLIIL